MALVNFFFSRYHFEIELAQEDKYQTLLDGLSNKGSVISYNFKYKFSTPEIIEEDGVTAIVGTLVKYSPLGTNETIDEETGEIVEQINSNQVVAKAKFLIHPTSSQIVYASVTNHISKKTFKDIFIKLVSVNNGHEPKDSIISISEINKEYSFVEKVKAVKKIKKISISVVPSNPHFSERWEKIDERLKQLRIDVYRETQQSNSNEGIIIDEETEALFLMAEDGYGNSVVQGENEFGNRVTLSTSQRDRQESQTLDIQENIAPKNLLRKLLEKIKSIGGRAREGNN